MEKITYGAPRLVDWIAQIRAGGATVRVHFTGGALTSYGVTPAEYTTTNPFIQKVIENSSYFKEGRIILLRKTEIADTQKPKKPKHQNAPHAGSASESKEETNTEEPLPTISTTEMKSETSVSETEAENAEAADLTKVDVTCLQDAHAYLQENFNISSYKVRSYEAAQKAALEHGVQFTGGKFDTLNRGENTESKEIKEE